MIFSTTTDPNIWRFSINNNYYSIEIDETLTYFLKKNFELEKNISTLQAEKYAD